MLQRKKKSCEYRGKGGVKEEGGRGEKVSGEK
jgi:hypothetical protein